MNILGYYIDADEDPAPSTVFVAFNDGDQDMSYSPVGQHSALHVDYLSECGKITKDEYLKYSSGFYTPEEYV